MLKKAIISSFIFLVLLSPTASAEQIFNPNFIISDYEVTNYQTMNQFEIQRFLESKKSYLANYICQDNNGVSMRASVAIYNVAITNRINPRFILALLQKEQSLIEESKPDQRSLDWATGYGCPDGQACNTRWQGFWKQINSASLQFRDYLDNPQLYTFKKGNTYQFTNPYSTTKKELTSVTPINTATAALYNYTPHVYNGNYNFWKIWNRYFTHVGYPSGTVVRVKGESGIWLIQNGQRRPFLTRGAFSSRFDFKKVLDITKSDLAYYEIGSPIKFPQYSIVRAPDKKLYLLVDDKKRPFDTDDAFKKIGYNPDEIINANWEDINSYLSGKAITVSEAYPIGALLQDKKSGAVYWINEGLKMPIVDPIILKTRFKNKQPIMVSADRLKLYPSGDPILLADGELVKLDKGFTIYVVENRRLRPIASMAVFKALGYQMTNLVSINMNLFKLYQIGETIN